MSTVPRSCCGLGPYHKGYKLTQPVHRDPRPAAARRGPSRGSRDLWVSDGLDGNAALRSNGGVPPSIGHGKHSRMLRVTRRHTAASRDRGGVDVLAVGALHAPPAGGAWTSTKFGAGSAKNRLGLTECGPQFDLIEARSWGGAGVRSIKGRRGGPKTRGSVRNRRRPRRGFHTNFGAVGADLWS